MTTEKTNNENNEYNVSRGILDEYGYNFREKFNIYAGIVLGTLAPIVGVKYMMVDDGSGGIMDEAIRWGLSISINSLPIFFKHLPVPFYTGIIGGTLGVLGAEGLKRNRLGEEPLFGRLEKISDKQNVLGETR